MDATHFTQQAGPLASWWLASTARGAHASSVDSDSAIALDLHARNEAAIRLAYHLTRDREAALDISQEAFIRALEQHRKLTDAAQARAWFDRIVVNLSRDWLRRKGAERRALNEVEGRARTRTNGSDSTAALREAIFNLPCDLREVVVLVCIEEHTPKDAAQILNLPEGTLRWRLHEGRKQLKAQFASETISKEASV